MNERRKYVRIDSKGEGFFECSQVSEEAKRFSICDLSIGGMRIVVDRALSEDRSLPLTFTVPGIEGELTADCRVARQRKLSDGRYEVGIEFKTLNTDDEIKLMDHIAETAGNIVECREFLRCPLETKVLYTLENGHGGERECTSADVSSLGLKLIFEDRMKQGTDLRLQFTLPEEAEPLCAVGRVAWVKHYKSGRTEAGIEFQDIDDLDRLKIDRYVQKTIEAVS
jgi:c-di-GMP-binding flagellar brake protein YcgR